MRGGTSTSKSGTRRGRFARRHCARQSPSCARGRSRFRCRLPTTPERFVSTCSATLSAASVTRFARRAARSCSQTRSRSSIAVAGCSSRQRCNSLARWRRSIASRNVLGPRLLLAGLVDGSGPEAFGTVTADAPEEGRAVVEMYHAAGFQRGASSAARRSVDPGGHKSDRDAGERAPCRRSDALTERAAEPRAGDAAHELPTGVRRGTVAIARFI